MKRIFIIAIVIAFPFISNAQSSLFNINYSIALPMGVSQDFIGNTSFSGASFEGRSFINDNISVGGYIGWNLFTETKNKQDYSGTGIDINGTQYRYLNMIPMQVVAHYYLKNFESVNPYIGLGAGATRSLQRTEIGLIAISNNDWHLGLSPEIGVYIPINFNVGLNVSARYDYAVKSNDTIHSNLTFNIGLSFLEY